MTMITRTGCRGLVFVYSNLVKFDGIFVSTFCLCRYAAGVCASVGRRGFD